MPLPTFRAVTWRSWTATISSSIKAFIEEEKTGGYDLVLRSFVSLHPYELMWRFYPDSLMLIRDEGYQNLFWMDTESSSYVSFGRSPATFSGSEPHHPFNSHPHLPLAPYERRFLFPPAQQSEGWHTIGASTVIPDAKENFPKLLITYQKILI